MPVNVMNLPGLATHFEKGRIPVRDGGSVADVACGRSVPESRVSSDPRKTCCISCRRTKAWGAAIWAVRNQPQWLGEVVSQGNPHPPLRDFPQELEVPTPFAKSLVDFPVGCKVEVLNTSLEKWHPGYSCDKVVCGHVRFRDSEDHPMLCVCLVSTSGTHSGWFNPEQLKRSNL